MRAYNAGVTHSVVLRLSPEPLLAGRLAGEVELVATGRRGVVSDADELYRLLLEREKLGTTALGEGVAVPHCKMRGLDEVVVAVGTFSKGIEFEAADGKPVQLLFLVISPPSAPAAHLQSLAAISKWVKADQHVERILQVREPQAIFEMLDEQLDS